MLRVLELMLAEKAYMDLRTPKAEQARQAYATIPTPDGQRYSRVPMGALEKSLDNGSKDAARQDWALLNYGSDLGEVPCHLPLFFHLPTKPMRGTVSRSMTRLSFMPAVMCCPPHCPWRGEQLQRMTTIMSWHIQTSDSYLGFRSGTSMSMGRIPSTTRLSHRKLLTPFLLSCVLPYPA